jgi:hypothetical protein
MKDWQHSLHTERCLFLLMILIEAGIFIYLVHGRWIVGGHDGFHYFVLQYYFLNNAVNYGEIPQWLPFTTQGNISSWMYIIQDGILQNILFLCGSLLKGMNFLPLFHAGFFLDELLLITGVWLLGRRFFASPFTIFFVTLSIMGSCIWMLQPWWNFHFYYAIPLILYLVHMFMDSGKWRYYFLAGNLLFIQCLGNLPYFLPVTSLIIFLYFLFYFLLNYQDTRQKIKAIRFGWSFIISSILIIALFSLFYIFMNTGTDQIVSYSSMRNPDRTASLDIFLTYGGKLSWSAWLELVLGISPFLNYTLYAGLISVPFILLGLIFNLNKKNVHFTLTIIILLLFSMGTFVSVFFYYSWPMMKYFRHLMLVSPIIKVFLCFLAGFGFDAVFFNKMRWNNPLITKVSLVSSSLFMLCVSLLLWFLSHNYVYCVNLLSGIVPAKHTFFRILLDESVLISLLNKTALIAMMAFILFAVTAFIRREKYFIPMIILLALNGADLYTFKFSEIKFKAAPLNEELYKITNFQPALYAKRRDLSFEDNNPRAELLNILPIKYGSGFYWSTHSFLFKDELGNHFLTDLALLPLDAYMKAYWGQSIHDLSVPPRGLLYYSRLDFPQGHPAILKISGVTEDKIQFFSEADFISSYESIASIITNSGYKGDVIFLSAPDNSRNINPVNASGLSKNDLAANKRLRLPYQIQSFNANNLEVTTHTGNLKSAWLFYSDVWHPLWRATVNGKETPVYKANLAYKAVKLEPGLNKIHFYFKSRLISVIYFLFGLNALCWLVIIIYLMGKIVFNNRATATNYQKPD